MVSSCGRSLDDTAVAENAPTAIESRVLIIIPTLGRRNGLLEQTLRSIRSQSVAVDLVVVTPGTATDARRLAQAYGARIADDPGGMAAALNVGLELALPQHEYMNWIGDDDLLTPGSLATTVAALDGSPDVSLAFGYCDYIDSEGNVLWTSRAGRFAPWLMTWGPDLIPQPGALFRTADVRAVGGFDPTLAYAMDLDLWMRLRKRGRLVNLATTLAAFRWHPDSVTVANRTASLDESEQVKRRYYSSVGNRAKFVWERPVRGATRLAALHLNRRARRARAVLATSRASAA